MLKSNGHTELAPPLLPGMHTGVGPVVRDTGEQA